MFGTLRSAGFCESVDVHDERLTQRVFFDNRNVIYACDQSVEFFGFCSCSATLMAWDDEDDDDNDDDYDNEEDDNEEEDDEEEDDDDDFDEYDEEDEEDEEV